MPNILSIRLQEAVNLHAKNWSTEAALRMLLNNLDAEVAEDASKFVVYGGIGKAARNRQSFEKIVECLLQLDEDHSLLIQSGKPVGIVRSHPNAPTVLDRKFQPCTCLGKLGTFQRIGKKRADDVWPDDSRQLDLYRYAGHSAGNLRNLPFLCKKYFNGDLSW